jgi:hypothetical protein
MTLNELKDGVSRLKGWKIITEDDSEGFSIPQADRRRQYVAVEEFRDESHPMVRFTTRIGPVDRLEPKRLRSALELNLRLPHGCLAIDGVHLVMTGTRPLGTTTPETTADALQFIAHQADQYEKLIFKTDVH